MGYNNVTGSEITAYSNRPITGTVTVNNPSQDYLEALHYAYQNALPMPVLDGMFRGGPAEHFRFMVDQIFVTYDYQAKLASYYFATASPTYSPGLASTASVLIEFHVG